MRKFIGARRARTLFGLVIFAGLSPFLLALMACLPAPVGDPEKSVVDPAISGVWMSPDASGSDRTLWILEPWDKRTWITTWLEPHSEKTGTGRDAAPQDDLSPFEAANSARVAVFKTWLAEIGEMRFLVLEPKTVVREDEGMAPEVWLVYMLNQPDPAHIELRLVEHVGGAETTAEIEAYIAAHAKDGELFSADDAPQLLHRVPEADYGRIEAYLKKFDIGLHLKD